ncbi:dihydrofolate reductase [Providencia huaxiensis]|uniref:dihydrofolate reductase n=1 Tax=Enterobacterales TaxID=91347 RepID=UPI0003737382|nr:MULTISPECIES: dihydrofolate reductase [Klebsiella]AZZ16427.1 dihydrofolate reductase [Klebsiella sp. LY]HDX8327520.1 dihydrofolate reductase [Raoultella ornithinolytica]HDX8339022.1 dihydrofolate reductase [Raoultella ornithinolytica]
MTKQVIFAVAENGAFGHQGGLPWPRHSEDLAWFYKLTQRTDLVMGAATYTTLPIYPSEARNFIVVSNTVVSNNPFVHVIKRKDFYKFYTSTGRNLTVIGGKSLITLDVLKGAEKIYMTTFKGSPVADTFLDEEELTYVRGLENKTTIFKDEAAHMELYYA